MQHSKPTILDVQICSTGSAAQHPEHRYQSGKPVLWWVLLARDWIKVPINVYVIRHRNGLVLFDTGLNPAIGSDPNYVSSAIGRFLLHRIFRLHIGRDDDLAHQLAALGYAASNVSKVAVSHLHFDHIGGISQVPQAELIVSRREWQRLSGPHPERDWILREHIELPGANWRQIDFAPTDDPETQMFGGCHDVMGDQSMVLVPTPGHTPGSMSMLLRALGQPPLLLVADLCYDAEALLQNRAPGIGDRAQLEASYAKVRLLKQRMPELIILPSHDPAAAGALKESGWSDR